MSEELRDKNGLTEAEFLAAYNPSKWERPSVTVDMICYCRENKSLLLVKRGGHPFLGKWALPGGFLEPNETAEEAVKRELFEETGVDAASIIQLRTFSNPHRDPRTRIVTIAFIAVLDKLPSAKAGDDAADAKWFELKSECTKSANTVKGKLTLDGEEALNIEYTAVYPENGIAADPALSVISQSARIAGDHGTIISYAAMKLRELGII